MKKAGEQAYAAWEAKFAKYKAAHSELAAQFEGAIAGELPSGWDADLPVYSTSDKPLSTRVASGNALNGLAKNIPLPRGWLRRLGKLHDDALERLVRIQAWQLRRPQYLLRRS